VSAKTAAGFRNDESGAVFVEMTAAILTFFLLIFGVVEFSYVFYQWNAANKAVQWGARLAAVSNPVASNLTSLTGLEPGTNIPGEAMPDYYCTCKYSAGAWACSGTVPTNATACTYDDAAMTVIFLGRGNDGTHCVDGVNAGMCRFLPGLKKTNIVVDYRFTGLGYAGRKAGPVPTITVSLQGIKYEFLFLSGLAGLTALNFPYTATTTVTGEDLKVSWSGS
jgi:Flp pilus assembly protein TadG